MSADAASLIRDEISSTVARIEWAFDGPGWDGVKYLLKAAMATVPAQSTHESSVIPRSHVNHADVTGAIAVPSQPYPILMYPPGFAPPELPPGSAQAQQSEKPAKIAYRSAGEVCDLCKTTLFDHPENGNATSIPGFKAVIICDNMETVYV